MLISSSTWWAGVADTSVLTPGSRLVAQTPERKLDTRIGIGGPATPFGPGETR